MKRLKLLTKLQEIHLLAFFISCFTVSVTPSIDAPKASNDVMILRISSMPSFEINKVNPFPALTAPFPLIFLLNLSISFKLNCLLIQVNFLLLKE